MGAAGRVRVYCQALHGPPFCDWPGGVRVEGSNAEAPCPRCGGPVTQPIAVRPKRRWR